MKPHPRIRKTVKWGGAALTVLLVVVWVGSGWWDVVWFWSWKGAAAPAAAPAWEMEQVTLGAGCIYARHGAFAPGTSPTAPGFPGSVALLSRRANFIASPFWWWQLAPVSMDDASPGAIPSLGGISRASLTRELTIPLWPPALVSLGLAVIGWRLDTVARRRAMLHLCGKCGYDRVGLPRQGPCPECGTVQLAFSDEAFRRTVTRA